jgi:hypothetical protein
VKASVQPRLPKPEKIIMSIPVKDDTFEIQLASIGLYLVSSQGRPVHSVKFHTPHPSNVPNGLSNLTLLAILKDRLKNNQVALELLNDLEAIQ